MATIQPPIHTRGNRSPASAAAAREQREATQRRWPLWPSVPPAYLKDGAELNDGHVCRDAELAALQFDGVPEFKTDGVGVATPEWREQLENYLFDFKFAVRRALVIVGQSKESLVDKTKGLDMEGSIQLAEMLERARGQALHLARFIQCAEIRQMCAVASYIEDTKTA